MSGLERENSMESPRIDPLNGLVFWVESERSTSKLYKHSTCDNSTTKILEKESLGAFYINPQSSTLTIADLRESQLLRIDYGSNKPDIRFAHQASSL